MELMTLRRASERTMRSVTTLRRYIRSGRLPAEKRPGRYGPEYFVSRADLEQAGLSLRDEAMVPSPGRGRDALEPLERVFRDSVPVSLYQELHMKHEQLLVQYGMVRAGGLRMLEIRSELEAKRQQLLKAQSELTRLRERHDREIAEVRKRLRQSELEVEGRRLEVSALTEKVRGLEMLSRNAVTTEKVERRYSEVMEQARRVERLGRGLGIPKRLRGPGPERDPGPEH